MKFTLKQWNIIHQLLKNEQEELEDMIRKMRKERRESTESDWDEKEWAGHSDLKLLEDRNVEIIWMLKKLEDEEI